MGTSRAVFFLFCLAITSISQVEPNRRRGRDPRKCQVPQWPEGLDFPDPVAARRGSVVLVALMKGYCGYCVQQAESLGPLKTHMAGQGYTDIEMVIVNGGENISRINIHNLENAVSFPVLQDTEDHVLFNDVFAGSKDDFVIYDRCGQRVFLIPHPYSYLGHSITERVLRAVHRGYHGCSCSLDRQGQTNFRDRMHGDQPMNAPTFRGETAPSNDVDIECPRGDVWCERYLTEMMQGTLGRGRRMGMHRPRYGGAFRNRQGRMGMGGRMGSMGGRRRGGGRRMGGRRGGRRGHSHMRHHGMVQTHRGGGGNHHSHHSQRHMGFGAAA